MSWSSAIFPLILNTEPYSVAFAESVTAGLDMMNLSYVVGTIAGDDTILIIPREGVSREEVERFLNAD